MYVLRDYPNLTAAVPVPVKRKEFFTLLFNFMRHGQTFEVGICMRKGI
jgi:hypothetical protein